MSVNFNHYIIRGDIENIKRACDDWLHDIDTVGNETAHSDRIVEWIIKFANKLNEDYEKQFKGEDNNG